MEKKLFITIGLLSLYLVSCFLPVFGINYSSVGSFPKIINLMLTNTHFERTTIFSLGIMPYVSAHIIIFLLLSVRAIRINKNKPYSPIYFVTIVLAIVQSYFIAIFLRKNLVYNNINLVIIPERLFYLTTTILITMGVIITIWIGNTITKKGIGNGISFIILLNLAMDILIKNSRVLPQLVFLIILIFAVTAFIFKKEINIPIQYIDNKNPSFLALPLNFAGVLPIIFTQSIILFPAVLSSFSHSSFLPKLEGFGFWFIYGVLVFFFAYFCTFMVFNPKVLLSLMKSFGAFISGKEQEGEAIKYLTRAVLKIALLWGLFLIGLTLLAEVLMKVLPYKVYFSGESLYLITGICIVCYSQLKNITRERKEILRSVEPIISMCKSPLQSEGIKTCVQSVEIYGSLYGLLFGPLSEKRLLVDEQDYLKSKEIIFKFIPPSPESK